MLGVGIIGCGFIANYHAAAIRHLSALGLCDAAITVVCDRDRDKAAVFAGDEARVVREPDALARDDDVDVVYVCTPTSSHAELVASVAASGKPVFCEKPLAFDAETAAAMRDAVMSVPNQVGLVLRYSPTYRGIGRRIKAGAAGALMQIVLRDDQFIPVRGHYGSTWRGDVAEAGGGTILEHSIHDVDVLSCLGGRISAVTAQTRNVAGHAGVEDNAAVVFEFESGALAVLASVWHDVDTRVSSRHLEALCRDAWLATDHDMVGPVEVHTATEQTRIDSDILVDELTAELGFPDPGIGRSVSYALEDWAFLEAVRTGAPPSPSFDDAVHAHLVVDAIYASAASGERVGLG